MINDRENVEVEVAKAIYETHLGPPPIPRWVNTTPQMKNWVIMQARSALRRLEDLGIVELEVK